MHIICKLQVHLNHNIKKTTLFYEYIYFQNNTILYNFNVFTITSESTKKSMSLYHVVTTFFFFFYLESEVCIFIYVFVNCHTLTKISPKVCETRKSLSNLQKFFSTTSQIAVHEKKVFLNTNGCSIYTLVKNDLI